MVTVTDFIIGFFVILGIVGGLAIITFPFVWLYHKWQMKKFKKDIPEKLKKEVEYGRTKKQLERERARLRFEDVAEGEREPEETSSIPTGDTKFIPSSRAVEEPEPNEPMVSSGDNEYKERNKPNRFTPI